MSGVSAKPERPEDKVAQDGPLRVALSRPLRPYLLAMLGFSLVSNLLLLVSPLYMLQVYDRVMTAGSYDTLIWLTLIAVFLLSIYGAAEAGRRRVAALAGTLFEQRVVPRVFARFESHTTTGTTLAHDLAQVGRVQAWFQNGGVIPFFDLPFAPFFVGVLFLVHPLLGLLGVGGAVLVFIVALMAEMSTRQTGQLSSSALSQAQTLAMGLERQRSAMVAMGLVPGAFANWRSVKQAGQGLALDAAKEDGKFTAISRSSRQILQILILGGGAALALSQQISPGAIVASSIILARALGPVDQIVGSWRSTIQTWRAWKDLRASLDTVLPVNGYTPLPRPASRIEIDRMGVGVPGSEAPLLRPFSHTFEGGQIIALTGGNGAGKTTLLQTLSGAWPVAEGQVRLGGRALHDWASADRGRYIGYVPQEIELLPGTVASNIARMRQRDMDDVFKAAHLAGAHEIILSLPEGYDTRIGPGGVHLSAGQRQLIALARAVYGHPVFLLLDEPTANLDSAAAQTVLQALTRLADAGTIIMASSHDRRLIEKSRQVLLVRNGSVMLAEAEQYLKLALGPGAAGSGA